MEINLLHVPKQVSSWAVTRALAGVLHSEEFPQLFGRKINFQIKLNPSTVSDVRNNGTGIMTLPSEAAADMLLRYEKYSPIYIPDHEGKPCKIKIWKGRAAHTGLKLTLQKTPYLDPDTLEKREEILRELDHPFPVNAVQVGILFNDKLRTDQLARGRSFSIEWELNKRGQRIGWLKIDYDIKRFRITLGDFITDEIEKMVAIPFSNIQKIGIGYDGDPYICFDLRVSPIFEETELHRTVTGDHIADTSKYRRRVGSLGHGHQLVAPYSKDLRIVLAPDSQEDVLGRFMDMCHTACLATDNLIRFCGRGRVPPIEALGKRFFSDKNVGSLRNKFKAISWPVAFQLEALLRNSLLHTEDVETLLSTIKKLCPRDDANYVGDLLRHYGDTLQNKLPGESPIKIFEKTHSTFIRGVPSLPTGYFLCAHVTFTPTRLLLEGPYATQSNRVIRQYAGYENSFIRVDFRDEDRLQYRWDREVDGSAFLEKRVGDILRGGFELGGRAFEFLAYSSSALREHAVWFISPFRIKDAHGRDGELINADKIRESVGDFKGTKLLQHPSKYAARLAQAFTATDPSVKININHMEEIDDITSQTMVDIDGELKEVKYTFTDGVGTISESLGNEIWEKLCENRRDHGARSVKPSVYQIRFLGYKGVVAVDKRLDDRKDGIRMRLRPSMRKFDNTKEKEAEIEIAMAFEHPNTCYLNRPLIMVLEHLGIRLSAFQALQDNATNEAYLIDQDMEHFCTVLNQHGLGKHLRIPYLLRRLRDDLDLELQEIDTPFLRQIRNYACADVLREIKHNARIPVPESYLLVGVADEGPHYKKELREAAKDIYVIPEGSIYVCVQESPDSEPTYLSGQCCISRSPVVHQGDVQRAMAIGRPPPGATFGHLKNCIVFSCEGNRPLPSCLGGGDLDGDLFSIIFEPTLMPRETKLAAAYADSQPWCIDRDSKVEDICNFIVEYIRSDVLGLLSDRLLVIADQSNENMADTRCLKLAALCSQAVDYPKQGVPVELYDLPTTLIRCKPDWHMAEVVSPRQTDYYVSERALGHLFRAITIQDPDDPLIDSESVLSNYNEITDALQAKITPFLVALTANDSENIEERVQATFKRWTKELNYICSTHTLSNDPAGRLREAEVALGTIMAKCSQKRWRKDRMYRMRLHASTVARDVQREMISSVHQAQAQELFLGLGTAWTAWNLSVSQFQAFGANTFGWLALGVIFDCLDRLEYFEVPLMEDADLEYDTNTAYLDDVVDELVDDFF